MPPREALAALGLAMLVAACIPPYRAHYRETQPQPSPVPKPAAQVMLVRSPYYLHDDWIELGLFHGHAPTLREATALGLRACGRAGADYFILLDTPIDAGAWWKLYGVCAVAAG